MNSFKCGLKLKIIGPKFGCLHFKLMKFATTYCRANIFNPLLKTVFHKG